MSSNIKAYYGQRVDFGFNDALIEFSEEDEKILEECKNLTLDLKKGALITLGDSVGDGGEGKVYDCNFPDFVVKIYKKDFRKISTQKKIEKLVRNNPKRVSLCWPVDAVYYKGKFVGFLMPKVSGKTMECLTTGNLTKIVKRYPNYTKEVQIKMILSILKEMEYLHSMNILLGDINLRNILFDPSTFDITFVDMDSVQIEEFPCITSSQGYDAPEVIIYRAIDKNGRINFDIAKEKNSSGEYIFNNYYHNFYRTLENEYHAISVLLFKLMTCGCMPYSYQEYGIDINDGYEDIELQIKKSFPYTLNRKDLNENCTRKEIWSHMPSFIKSSFVDAFTGVKRVSTNEWISLFEIYEDLLKNNKINDSQKNKVFPDDEIDYQDVKITTREEYVDKGFLMSHAVARVMKPYKDSELNAHIGEVIEALKHKPVYILDKYTFSLVYNIGILKKVKSELTI